MLSIEQEAQCAVLPLEEPMATKMIVAIQPGKKSILRLLIPDFVSSIS